MDKDAYLGVLELQSQEVLQMIGAGAWYSGRLSDNPLLKANREARESQ